MCKKSGLVSGSEQEYRYTCSICNNNFLPGHIMHGCRKCDFDACSDCFHGEDTKPTSDRHNKVLDRQDAMSQMAIKSHTKPTHRHVSAEKRAPRTPRSPRLVGAMPVKISTRKVPEGATRFRSKRRRLAERIRSEEERRARSCRSCGELKSRRGLAGCPRQRLHGL